LPDDTAIAAVYMTIATRDCLPISQQIQASPSFWKDRERLFFLRFAAAFYVVWIAAFELVGRYAVGLPTRDYTTALDRAIPLVSQFVWPYQICYVFPFLPLFVLRDWHRFNRAILALVMANTVAFTIHVFVPVAFPRPELGHSLSDSYLRLIYAGDFSPGACKLPSLHVTFAWIVYFACRKQRLSRAGDLAVLLVAALISVSTLFVKQHILIDVVAGFVLAWVSWTTASWVYPRVIRRESDVRKAAMRMVRVVAPIAVMLGVVIYFAAETYWAGVPH
jgi:membrane-associated phospholipid phosphatase